MFRKLTVEVNELDENFHADMMNRQGVVLTVHGKEVQFFDDKKQAGAFALHTYGEILQRGKSTLWNLELLGVKVDSARIEERGPKPGDGVVYEVVEGKFYSGGFGTIEKHNYGKDQLSVCFGASAYRTGEHVDCSGGPIPAINAEDLTFIGTHPRMFWRWHDGTADTDNGGKYEINVPCWRWNGNEITN